MTRHVQGSRTETRWSSGKAWVEGDRIKHIEHNYPCLTNCKDPAHRHNGQTVLVWVTCSCGWEELVGDHVSDCIPLADHQFILHRLDALEAVT